MQNTTMPRNCDILVFMNKILSNIVGLNNNNVASKKIKIVIKPHFSLESVILRDVR